jgi:hypothetical protein
MNGPVHYRVVLALDLVSPPLAVWGSEAMAGNAIHHVARQSWLDQKSLHRSNAWS